MAQLMGNAILLPSLSNLVSFILVSIDISLSSICLGPQLTIFVFRFQHCLRRRFRYLAYPDHLEPSDEKVDTHILGRCL